MKLYGLSDLHVGYKINREAVTAMGHHPDDWLLLVGDVGETLGHMRFTLEALCERFAQVVWVPGNHELWTHPRCESKLRGRARYTRLIDLCRARGVLTPEDPYVRFPGDGTWIVPLFLGIDYSFGPPGLSPEQMRAWAAETGIASTDERFWRPDPYESLSAWCHARVLETQQRLQDEIPVGEPTVLMAHWPLRSDLIRLPERIERFSPWCGTRLTRDWHTLYNAKVVVTGHLHMRATDWVDGVRFEEVAVGYPRHWHTERGLDHYLREILPGPASGPTRAGPVWHR